MSADKDDRKYPAEIFAYLARLKLDMPRKKLVADIPSPPQFSHFSPSLQIDPKPSKRVAREFRNKLESDLADAVKRQEWHTVAIIARNLDRIDNPNRIEHTSQLFEGIEE